MNRIAILASGGGSNALKIMEHFANSDVAEVAIVISNNSSAGVLGKAESFNVPTHIHSMEELNNGQLLNVLIENSADFIVLAGYLKKISPDIVEHFDGRIVNIHPALLPDYGGKGMYGMNVHKAVVADGRTESGMTIHYVNNNYDEGNIILQKKFQLSAADTPVMVAIIVLPL
mgnify:CR=1 FL=1